MTSPNWSPRWMRWWPLGRPWALTRASTCALTPASSVRPQPKTCSIATTPRMCARAARSDKRAPRASARDAGWSKLRTPGSPAFASFWFATRRPIAPSWPCTCWPQRSSASGTCQRSKTLFTDTFLGRAPRSMPCTKARLASTSIVAPPVRADRIARRVPASAVRASPFQAWPSCNSVLARCPASLFGCRRCHPSRTVARVRDPVRSGFR